MAIDGGCNVQLEVTQRTTLQLDFGKQGELLAVVRQVAEYYYGALGVFYYDAFEHINRMHFGGDLPVPLLQIAMTPYGKCVGYTLSKSQRQPIVRMHPSLVRKQTVSLVYGYDVLLHECCHVAVDYLIGAGKGDTSHNCEGWIELVNNLSPALGLPDVNAQRTKAVRQGKNVYKATAGNMTQQQLGAWPHSLRIERDPDWYQKAELPFVPTVSVAQIRADAASIRH